MPIKINGTNTAANPSITGDDTDTGIVYGSDQIDFSTGGTSRANIDSSGNINIPNDSGKIQLGTSTDLQIYHDGTDSILKDTRNSGNLRIHADSIGFNDKDVSETMLLATADGSVDIYYNGSKKFETKSDGVLVTGELQATTLDINGNGHIDGTLQLTNDLFLGDNDEINIGSSNDLKIYHDGSNSIINDNGTGQLQLQVGGSTKFNTQSGGVQFYGSLYADDNNKIELGNDQDLQIYHDGTNSIINNNTGDLYIQSDGNLKIEKKDGGDDYIHCIADGAVELHYDGSKKLNTHPNGIFTQGIYPMSDNTYDIGSGSERFDDIFATNGTIQTSDENAKKDIVTSDLGLTFINAVKPVSYKFKTGTRTHYGVIAQDLETVLDGKDFAGLIKDTETNNYGIRYTELIAPLIKAIQELSAEVETLKTKVAALEAA